MTITDFLNNDENYFQYFLNNIDKCVNYFEYQGVFGDSYYFQLFYIKKKGILNFNEALVQLTIPYLYKTGSFRQLNSFDKKEWFQSINKDLQKDIYYESLFDDALLKDFYADLELLTIKQKESIIHYESKRNGGWEKSETSVLAIIDECKTSIKTLKKTLWDVNFEYYGETENYYVMYRFSTGA